MKNLEGQQISFKRKSPCPDCPFRKNPGHRRPEHIENMGLLIKPIILGTAAHTCHKTDPRSDHAPAKKYKGPIEHCVGMILMCEKSGSVGEMQPYHAVAKRGELDLKALRGGDQVMSVFEFGKLVRRTIERRLNRK